MRQLLLLLESFGQGNDHSKFELHIFFEENSEDSGAFFTYNHPLTHLLDQCWSDVGLAFVYMGSNLLQEATKHHFLFLAMEIKIFSKGGVLKKEGDEHFAYIRWEVPVLLLFLVLGIILGSLYWNIRYRFFGIVGFCISVSEIISNRSGCLFLLLDLRLWKPWWISQFWLLNLDIMLRSW